LRELEVPSNRKKVNEFARAGVFSFS